MIQMEYINDKDTSLLTIVFDKTVLSHLKAKSSDNLYVCQSAYNARLFTLAKSNTGYKIKKLPNKKYLYQISIKYKFNYIDEFSCKDCIYFLNKKNIIRIKLM